MPSCGLFASQGSLIIGHQFPVLEYCSFQSTLCSAHFKAGTPYLPFVADQGGASLEAALDWLCLHLPQGDLPKLFAGGVRAGGTGAQVFVCESKLLSSIKLSSPFIHARHFVCCTLCMSAKQA